MSILKENLFFLRSRNAERLLSQIKGNSINYRIFFFALFGATNDYSHTAPKKPRYDTGYGEPIQNIFCDNFEYLLQSHTYHRDDSYKMAAYGPECRYP